jgi:hypothetical protein
VDKLYSFVVINTSLNVHLIFGIRANFDAYGNKSLINCCSAADLQLAVEQCTVHGHAVAVQLASYDERPRSYAEVL